MGEPVPFRLSFPPSCNSLWRNVDGNTLVSRRYRAWKKTAAVEIMAQRPTKVHGPYRLTLVATRPDRRRRDLSNLLKATEDAIVAAGLVRDDSDCTSLWLRWSDGPPNPAAGVSVTLEAA